MKKRTKLLLIPLSAALLFLGNAASNLPGVVKRPAAFLPAASPGAVATSLPAENSQPDRDIAAMLAKVDYPPAQEGILEAVIVQGTVGERRAAIRELRQRGSAAAIQTLSIALGDEDPRVSGAAFEALSAIGGDEALAAIAGVAADYDPLLRERAIEALGDAGGYSAVDYLELALRDEDAGIRAAAVMALGDLNDSRSVNIISLALRDPDVEVRQRAAEMLDELNDDALFHALYPPQ